MSQQPRPKLYWKVALRQVQDELNEADLAARQWKWAGAYDRDPYITSQYWTSRKEILQSEPVCQYCQISPSTSADHIISVYDADAVVGAGLMTRDEVIAAINDLSMW